MYKKLQYFFDNSGSNATNKQSSARTNQQIITDAICYFCQSVGIERSNHQYICPSPQLYVQYWICSITPHLVTGKQYDTVVQFNTCIHYLFKTHDYGIYTSHSH